MAKKRLDVTAITNELEHSAFFPTAQPAAPHTPQVAHASSQEERTQPDEAASTAPAPAPTTPLPTQQSTAQRPPAPDIPTTEQSQTDALRITQRIARADSTENRPATPQEESQLARNHASNDASFPASTLARDQERMPHGTSVPERSSSDTSHSEATAVRGSGHEFDMIEAIRKCVRQIGKEVSFVRLTPEEKRQLTDIAYTYKSQGLKTSENEISRIGINWLLEDYLARGPESVLARVLAALNA